MSISELEKNRMPSVKKQLYLWSFVYYIIMFVLPQFAILHDCEATFDVWLFYVYGAYLILQGIWEVYVVLVI